jgi:Asp-tRNA(Asn)/Glu-tRNA(Gln) amidotransferase A subunit family amidase
MNACGRARRRRQACLDVRDMDEDSRGAVAPQPAPATTLSGIPFGAKDIMETRGLSTDTPPISRAVSARGAAIVTSLRRAGQSCSAKTHTPRYRTPAPARNRGLEHTGRRSSGSAAVATGMVRCARHAGAGFDSQARTSAASLGSPLRM